MLFNTIPLTPSAFYINVLSKSYTLFAFTVEVKLAPESDTILTSQFMYFTPLKNPKNSPVIFRGSHLKNSVLAFGSLISGDHRSPYSYLAIVTFQS